MNIEEKLILKIENDVNDFLYLKKNAKIINIIEMMLKLQKIRANDDKHLKMRKEAFHNLFIQSYINNKVK